MLRFTNRKLVSRIPSSPLSRRVDKAAKRLQKGGMLLESMVGLLIMGIVGAGVVHVTGRAAVVQQQMAVQDIVVREMRDLLLRHRTGALDLCTDALSITIRDGSDPVDVVADCATVNATLTVGGNTVNVANARRPLVLSAEVPGLGLVRVGGNTDA